MRGAQGGHHARSTSARCCSPSSARWRCPSRRCAQAWPTRPVTMIVPFPAGGNADVLARALAPELSEKLGQQFIVDNRAGAGGNIGGAAVAKAAPDGYTFMFGTPGPIATNKLMYKSLPYDPEKDLAPVVLVAKSPLIVAAHPSIPGEGPEGADRLRQGQSRQGQCRQSRQRHARPHHLGAAAAAHRHEDDPCALSRHGAAHDRPARRTGAMSRSTSCRPTSRW